MYLIELNENREDGVKGVQVRANNKICKKLEKLSTSTGILVFEVDYLFDESGSHFRMGRQDKEKINKFLKDVHLVSKNWI